VDVRNPYPLRINLAGIMNFQNSKILFEIKKILKIEVLFFSAAF